MVWKDERPRERLVKFGERRVFETVTNQKFKKGEIALYKSPAGMEIQDFSFKMFYNIAYINLFLADVITHCLSAEIMR